jgi:4-hydroxybenzoate polyprenyltransferase
VFGRASAPETLTVGPGFLPPVARVREVTDDTQYSRTKRTQITFGPVGRIVATTLIVGPAVVMALLPGGAGWAGAAIWGVLVVPIGLRDVWRRGRVR